jgi:transposase
MITVTLAIDRSTTVTENFGGGPTTTRGTGHNAIFYVLSTGCQWQALPKDLPPKSTAHHYFHAVGMGWHVGALASRALLGNA